MARRNRAQWAALLEELEASGQVVSKFCARRGLEERTLLWWRWKLGSERRLMAQSTPPMRMLAVDVVESAVPAESEVLLEIGEAILKFKVGTSPDYIVALVSALRTRC
jgi:hypothetical protein